MPRRLAFACVVFALLTSTLALTSWSGTAALADDETPAKQEPAKKAPPTKAPAAEPPAEELPKAPRTAEDLRKDIEELVRRSGKLPEGYRPSGFGPVRPPPMGGVGAGGAGSADLGTSAAQAALGKALGTLLLKYLDEKDDPVKAAVYEELLRDLGASLAEGDAARPERVTARLMGRFMTGMQDPTKAPVYRAIFEIFGEALTASLRVSPPSAVPEPPAGRGAARPAPASPSTPPWPRTLGGAELVYVAEEGSPHIAVVLRRIPPDSPAHAAGLKPGDTLLALDGAPATPATLRKAEGAFVPGGKLRIRLRRMNGKTERLELEFEAAEPETPAPKAGK